MQRSTSALLPAILFASLMAGKVYALAIPDGYSIIAKQHGVPAKILFAIALKESQVKTNVGSMRVWPWTANLNGVPYRFNSRDELYAFVKEKIGAGHTSIDICASQINWKWNGQHYFEDIYQSTDPVACLQTSAKILKKLYDDTNDWGTAIGMYHNPTNANLASKYRQGVFNIMGKIDGINEIIFAAPNDVPPLPLRQRKNQLQEEVQSVVDASTPPPSNNTVFRIKDHYRSRVVVIN
jgi:hypothetical protein